jgi:hypothetical protein
MLIKLGCCLLIQKRGSGFIVDGEEELSDENVRSRP